MLYKYCLDPWLSPSAPAPAPVRSRSLRLQLKLHRPHLLSQVKNHVVIVSNLQSWALHSFKRTFRSFCSFPFFIKVRSVLSVLFRSKKRTFRSFLFPFGKERKEQNVLLKKNGCPTLPNCLLLEESEHQLTTKKGGGN